MAKASASTNGNASSSKNAQFWRPTKMMNMRDLSKDDDFLSHLLVEKLGTGAVPLFVHKMDPSRRFPKTDAADLLCIVRRLVTSKSNMQHAIRQAVDELLLLPPIRYYIKEYTQKQINAFATHASRYFELYNPSGVIEIAHTSRYAHRTGKSELCILATRKLLPGTVIIELKGSMADLTDEEDRELKRTDLRSCEVRRDFSVIHSRQMKKNHLFLGPARFVNHDCGNNCELFREGRYITFRVIKPIMIGEEITAHYGDGYFGRNNRHCLCETCEKTGRGGYSPNYAAEVAVVSSDSDSDGDSDASSSSDEGETNVAQTPAPIENLNERRTRRGVYAIVQDEVDSDDSDEETTTPLLNLQDIPAPSPADIEVETPKPAGSSRAATLDSVSLHLSSPISTPTSSKRTKSISSTPSLINVPSTWKQKARQEAGSSSLQPASSDSTPTRRQPARTTSSLSRLRDSSSNRIHKGKEKAEDPMVKKEEEESRVLRARVPATTTRTGSVKDTPAEAPKSIPVGPDGKPLPTCATCSSVLPVISVDSRVVWGIFDGSPKGKKKQQKQDCPRCMRHVAIYGLPWPGRITTPGTASSATPAESTPQPETASSKRVTKQSLTAIDRKLAAAASAKARREQKPEDEPPLKKRKTDCNASVAVNSPRGTASARPKTYQTCNRGVNGIDPATGKPKRGRPRNDAVGASKGANRHTVSAPIRIKSEEEEIVSLSAINLKAEAVKDQPREGNGRFGKKSKKFERSNHPDTQSQVLSRAERASEREKMKQRREAAAKASISAGQKRGLDYGDTDAIDDDRPAKRSQFNLPVRKPSPANSFKMGLSFRPNPLSYSRRTWLTSQEPEVDAPPFGLVDDVTTSESEGPVTPAEHSDSSPAPIIINVDLDPKDLASGESLTPLLTVNPTPFTFARRRWKSVGSSNTSPTATKSPSPLRISPLDAPLTPTNTEDSVFDIEIKEFSQGPRHFPVLDGDNNDFSAGIHRTRPIFSVLSKEYAYPLQWAESETNHVTKGFNPALYSKQIHALTRPLDKSTEPDATKPTIPRIMISLGASSGKTCLLKQVESSDIPKSTDSPSSDIQRLASKLVNAAWETYTDDDS